MQLRLHANATTTPRTRAYLQRSTASTAALARELGIHPRTVARWKARQDAADRSTRPHRLATPITAWEEGLILELRRSLALPLDDIVEAMRRCINPQLSRSGIHRCLKRHGLSARLTPQQAPAAAFQTDTPASSISRLHPYPGFIHIDVKYLPPLGRRRSYAGACPGASRGRDRSRHPLCLSRNPPRSPGHDGGRLSRALSRPLPASGPHHPDRQRLRVHRPLRRRQKRQAPRQTHDKPSGAHSFDRLCAARAIIHRLTQPFRPQTNGRVERFNRRLGEHLDRLPQNRAAHHRRFLDHAERDAYLDRFVADYNHTPLRCLDYQAPAELLAKLAGHNTCAGAGRCSSAGSSKP
jgi:hypothetical protein